jgi:CheY-like chemotaxis protein
MWAQARAASFDAILVKPITPSTLNDALARVLRRSGATWGVAPEAGTAETETLLRSRHAGQRVLLVEDNPINQEVADELLRSVGLVVETADDGAMALAMAASRPYDLVLMDVQMPVMDGLAATRALRRQLGGGLPIVAMTANAFGEDRRQCLEAGMNDHVAKPVDPHRLYATLLRWLPLRTPAVSATPVTPGPARMPAPAEAAAGAPTAHPPATAVSAGGVEAPAAAAAAAAPPPLAERLLTIEGYDLEAALHHVGGSMPVLGRVLQRFVESYRGGAPVLRRAPEAGTLAEWRGVCHSLRGACSAVGISGLAQQLHGMEQALDQWIAQAAAGSSDGPPPTSPAELVSLADLAAQGLAVDQTLTRLTERLAAELQA